MEGDETRGKGVLCRRNKKACINCSKKCLRVHKKSLSVSDTASFFKVMLGDFTQFLYIPPAFAQTMTDLIDKSILLEDSSGASWTVRVCMKRRSLAFGHGWCRFVLDHSIDAGEFVVFRKAGQSIFSVQIFSISGCERLSFYETKKRSGNKRKRMQTVVPNARRSKETKNGRIPTIQEVTRREERRARRTNAIIRRLIMEDIENEDLLVKEDLPIITPIATMPSEGPLSLCSSQNVENLTMDVTTCFSLAENNCSVNGIERGKCKAVTITTDKKNRYDGAKMTGEDPHFICEKNSVQDAASRIESVYSQRISGRSPITKFFARTRKNAAKTSTKINSPPKSTKAAIDEAKLVQALQDEVLASNPLQDQQMQQVRTYCGMITPAAATDTDPLQKEDAIGEQVTKPQSHLELNYNE